MHIDPIDQARRLADAALDAMAQRQIAPSPNHYLIWYSHCSGCYPELSARLRLIERQREPFTDARLAELHERFFGTGRQVRLLDETCQRIESTMSHLLAMVGGMSHEATAYGNRLETLSSELDEAKPSPDLQALVAEIVAATSDMLTHARRVEAEMAESSQQIEGLRSDLARAQHEANTDSLTGIANRKYFDYELGIAAEESRTKGEPLSLLLADIDHFKLFNDTHGHQIGDQVLRLVAQVLTQSVKGRDLAARYGGEEFAVILPQTELEGARKLAEQVRKTVAGNRIRLKVNRRQLGKITLSIGCAEFDPREALSELIWRADEALYQAKRQGRNQVLTAVRDPLAASAAWRESPAARANA
jgi:diguanylate cyclase